MCITYSVLKFLRNPTSPTYFMALEIQSTATKVLRRREVTERVGISSPLAKLIRALQLVYGSYLQ